MKARIVMKQKWTPFAQTRTQTLAHTHVNNLVQFFFAKQMHQVSVDSWFGKWSIRYEKNKK